VRNGPVWVRQQRLLAGDGAKLDHFGHSVSINGDTCLIGAFLATPITRCGLPPTVMSFPRASSPGQNRCAIRSLTTTEFAPAISSYPNFADGIGTGDLASGELVDGMKLDERGDVYVTGPKGVWVFAPDGELLGVIQVPENVGNLNWGDDDWRSLYIPASTSIYRVRMKVAGNQLGYMQ